MPVTDQGFQRQTQAELIEEARANFQSKFTVGSQQPATDPESFFGLLSALIGEARNEVQQTLEQLYFSIFISTATGVQLDRVANPTVRNSAIKATVSLSFTGTGGTIIPVGTQFDTEEGVGFVTIELVTLDGAGNGTGNAEAVEAGAGGNQPAGSITIIPVPISGLNTVTNSSQSIGGEEVESDADFRTRAINERSVGRTSSLQSIINNVLTVDDVTDVIGFENNTNVTDGQGRPAGSVEIIARGGTDQAVGEAIFARVAGGISTFGSTSINVTDANGDNQVINFNRVTLVNIFVQVNLTTNTNYVAAQHDDLVKQAILDYIGGINPESDESLGAGISEDILAWKAQASLFELSSRDAIPGITDVTVLFGLTASPVDQPSIAIAPTEEATTQFADITVTEV